MAVKPGISDLTQADRDQIEASIRRWTELSLARDFEALVSELCTEDVKLLPPDHAVVEGRADAAAFLESFPEMAAFAASATDILGCGDVAVVEGAFDMTLLDEGQRVQAIGKWIFTYRKTTDGWKVTRDIWNNDQPLE